MIADGIKDDAQSSDKATPCDVISINQNSSTDLLLSLVQLFDKADDAKYGTIRANQEEILRWYYYGKEFLTQISVIVQDGKGKIGEKKAKGIIYDKMLKYLLKKQDCVSQKSPIKTYKGKFRKLMNSISELTNDKVQNIIDNFSKHNDNDNTNVKEASSHITEISVKSNLSFTSQIISTKVENHVDYDEIYYNDEAYFNDSIPLSIEKKTNEVQIDDDSNCSHDNDSEEEMPNNSYNNDRYNEYSEYNKWDNHDRGYYSYSDEKHERKTSLTMKIFDELTTHNIKINTSITAEVIKIKNEINIKIADNLFSRDGSITAEIKRTFNTKIANKLFTYFFGINSTFIADLSRINNKLNNKVNEKVNAKFSRINTELSANLPQKLKKSIYIILDMPLRCRKFYQ
ncbi:hypothetical protein C1645_825964 [Glomus cerebriforme]|uniref:Uncharacterized protein n=1 Tax=Glomus cerebriforme TaxID=658196 RepID=A0A397SXX7_9GLOM|nr:hypothetical protein C1645_825964 [Glomus cerebriforme]